MSYAEMAESMTHEQRMIAWRLRNHLQKKFLPYKKSDIIVVANLPSGKEESLAIGYRTKDVGGPNGLTTLDLEQTTHFDWNIKGNILYRCFTMLEPSLRGKNYWKALYLLTEDFAREMGCSMVRLSASGWTPRGETRYNYMVRKLGYQPLNDREIFKPVVPLLTG